MWCPVFRVVQTARTVLIRRLAVEPGDDSATHSCGVHVVHEEPGAAKE